MYVWRVGITLICDEDWNIALKGALSHGIEVRAAKLEPPTWEYLGWKPKEVPLGDWKRLLPITTGHEAE